MAKVCSLDGLRYNNVKALLSCGITVLFLKRKMLTYQHLCDTIRLVEISTSIFEAGEKIEKRPYYH